MAIDIDITKTKEDKIKEVLKQHFESEIRSDSGICSYLIFPDGTLVGSYAHRDCLDYLVDKGVLSEEEISQWDTDIFNEVFNCVRATDIDADENYIGLPENALTDAQYEALEKWIDNNFSLGRPTLQVTAKFNTDNQTTAFYNYDEIIDDEWPTDYIIKKIRKYYNTGKLEEDLDMNANVPLPFPKKYRHVIELSPEDFEKIEEYFNDIGKNSVYKKDFEETILPYKDQIISGEYIAIICQYYDTWYKEEIGPCIAVLTEISSGALHTKDYIWINLILYKNILKLIGKKPMDEDLDLVPTIPDKKYILEQIKDAYDFCFNDVVVIVNDYLFDFEEGFYLNDIITIGDNGEVLKSTTGGSSEGHAIIDTIQDAYNEDYGLAETIKFLKPWVEELKKHPEEFKPAGYYTDWIASFLWDVGGVYYMNPEDREEIERDFDITFDEFLK